MSRLSQSFGSLVSEEALFLDTSVKINFWVGIFMMATAGLVLLFAEARLVPISLVLVQMAIGFVLAAAFPVSRVRPQFAVRFVAVQGFLICLLVVAYVPFMWFTTRHLVPGLAADHRSYRVSHAPGVLALGLGYGLRLAYDFGRNDKRVGSVARKVGWAGVTIGALADLFVLYLVMSTFTRAHPHVVGS